MRTLFAYGRISPERPGDGQGIAGTSASPSGPGATGDRTDRTRPPSVPGKTYWEVSQAAYRWALVGFTNPEAWVEACDAFHEVLYGLRREPVKLTDILEENLRNG